MQATIQSDLAKLARSPSKGQTVLDRLLKSFCPVRGLQTWQTLGRKKGARALSTWTGGGDVSHTGFKSLRRLRSLDKGMSAPILGGPRCPSGALTGQNLVTVAHGVFTRRSSDPNACRNRQCRPRWPRMPTSSRRRPKALVSVWKAGLLSSAKAPPRHQPRQRTKRGSRLNLRNPRPDCVLAGRAARI